MAPFSLVLLSGSYGSSSLGFIHKLCSLQSVGRVPAGRGRFSAATFYFLAFAVSLFTVDLF